jgi:hypothetical protein
VAKGKDVVEDTNRKLGHVADIFVLRFASRDKKYLEAIGWHGLRWNKTSEDFE